MISKANKFKDYMKFVYPLCLFNFIQQLTSMVDIINSSYLTSAQMSYVVYIDQVMLTILAFGTSVTVGLSILVSKRLESGLYTEVKDVIATVMSILVLVGILFILFVVFGTNLFLHTILAPEVFYTMDNTYLFLRTVNNLFLFLNLGLLAIEKAKGSSKRVFMYNIIGLASKVIISFVVLEWFHMSLTINGVITLIPTLIIFIICLHGYLTGDARFIFSLSNISIHIGYIKEVFKFAIPLFLSLSLFSIGKLLVNKQAIRYGVDCVGYLGISNRLTGLLVSASNGVQEGISIIIARYRSSDNSTIRSCIKYSIGLNILIPAIGVIIYVSNYNSIMMYFADGDTAVATMIGTIFAWELSGAVLNPTTNFMSGVLYGYERTKLVFVISFFRIIVFRNIILLLLGLTSIGYQALGIVMFISHVTTFIVSLIIMQILFGRNKLKSKSI